MNVLFLPFRALIVSLAAATVFVFGLLGLLLVAILERIF